MYLPSLKVAKGRVQAYCEVKGPNGLVSESSGVGCIFCLDFGQGQLTIPYLDKTNIGINLFTAGGAVDKSAKQSQSIESTIVGTCAVGACRCGCGGYVTFATGRTHSSCAGEPDKVPGSIGRSVTCADKRASKGDIHPTGTRTPQAHKKVR